MTTETTYHGHACPLGSTPCKTGYEHSHADTLNATDGHSHANTVLSFGSANLGSPWWAHTHPISLVSMGSAGALHNHTSRIASNDFCIWEMENPGYTPHSHGDTGFSSGNAGASHTHGITGKYTGYADQTGTPENHVHGFSINTDSANSHYHTLTGTITNTTCSYGINHTHTLPSPSQTNIHAHLASGNSGYGGEPLPTAVVIAGDGLFSTA